MTIAVAIWAALAFTVGRSQPTISAILLVAYPLWDCLANYVDAVRSGGLRVNPTQMLNAVISAVVTLTFATTVGRNTHDAIGIIGVWTALAGILQVSTGARRWRSAAAQWPQILSGVQSSVGGAHFVIQALNSRSVVGAADIAGYAGFGALYFTISAGALAFRA